MAITIDGSSLVFEGTVTITNFTDPSAGVVTLTLTPNGGVGTLPALVAGQPGPAPQITSFTVNTVSPGQSASGQLNQTNPGGPGVASTYAMILNIPQGQAGQNGTSGNFHQSTDVTGTLAAGMTAVATSSTAFAWQNLPVVGVYSPTTINNISASGQVTELLCSVACPAIPYNWYPICFATATAQGNTTTAVGLQALLNNSNNGNVVGAVNGVAGDPTQSVAMLPGFGSVVNQTSGYGVVAAGSNATIYLNAVQSGNTSASWSIASSSVYFTVLAVPTSANA